MISFDLHGKTVRFDLDQLGTAYACLGKGRFYEAAFLEYIRSLDRHGTYVDVGTNIGNHLLYFSLFCPSRKVIGFEPVPGWRKLALRTIEANGIAEKAIVHPFGLSEQDETLIFKPYQTEYLIDCRTMDDVLGDVTDICVVKMDIEGSEPKAIAGARTILQRCRPVLFAEAATDSEYRSVVDAAAQAGYAPTGKVFNATPTYEFLPL